MVQGQSPLLVFCYLFDQSSKRQCKTPPTYELRPTAISSHGMHLLRGPIEGRVFAASVLESLIHTATTNNAALAKPAGLRILRVLLLEPCLIIRFENPLSGATRVTRATIPSLIAVPETAWQPVFAIACAAVVGEFAAAVGVAGPVGRSSIAIVGDGEMVGCAAAVGLTSTIRSPSVVTTSTGGSSIRVGAGAAEVFGSFATVTGTTVVWNKRLIAV